MNNTIGTNITLTVFGESHGCSIGACIDGIPAGIKVPFDYIQAKLNLRKAKGAISTARHEEDQPIFLSGIYNGYTEGNPISFILKNKQYNDAEYQVNIARPSHADYVAYEKYFHYMNMAGGNFFSGRLTAVMVVAGAFCQKMLEDKKIFIGSHIEQLKNIKDRSWQNYEQDLKMLSQKEFPVLDEQKEKEMYQQIMTALKNGDSVGGILETAIIGLPVGLGNPIFASLEAELARAIFAIPAVKGIAFGKGFDFTNFYGSEVNDLYYYDQQVKTRTNNNGGINGGISNGMPLIFHTSFKPTASISKKQESINLETKKQVFLQLNGRHDPTIIHRARVVVDAMTAFVLMNAYIEREKECIWQK